MTTVHDALVALADGGHVPERSRYDFKEEAGRRGPRGEITPGASNNESAAQSLAPSVACMSNTPGGGALIVGVADDLTVIGTSLDADWLQRRLYEILNRAITTVITDYQIDGHRILIIRCPSAVEPIRVGGRTKWRVGDQCVDIDIAQWYERRRHRSADDWSAEAAAVGADDARSSAIAIARRFLRNSDDDRAHDLAEATDRDLLRRLNVVGHDGALTNAGALLFVGRGEPGLDYLRRPRAGADSEDRVNEGDRSLLEELDNVFITARAYNPETHIDRGLVIGRMRHLPERAVREAIINGVAHRDWTRAETTVIEHVGATIRVTSPGGFYGGVRADNIINHPSTSRNTLLTQVLATLHVAERQGIGVDRMYADMLRAGHPEPSITEHDGTRVVTTLAGDRPDEAWIRWLGLIADPADATRAAPDDLRVLMALNRLVRQWWTDSADLAPYLQLPAVEVRQVMGLLGELTLAEAGGAAVSHGVAIAHHVDGLPSHDDGPVLALTKRAWEALQRAGPAARKRAAPTRESIARSYARHFGRISTTELGSIVGVSASNMGTVLRSLEEDGYLAPSRPNRRGPGFYYRWLGSNH